MRFIHLQNRNKNEEKIKKHNDLVNKFIPFDICFFILNNLIFDKKINY